MSKTISKNLQKGKQILSYHLLQGRLGSFNSKHKNIISSFKILPKTVLNISLICQTTILILPKILSQISFCTPPGLCCAPLYYRQFLAVILNSIFFDCHDRQRESSIQQKWSQLPPVPSIKCKSHSAHALSS